MYGCAPECVHHVHAGSLGGQKRVSHPLEVWLQVFVSYHVGVGNRIWVFSSILLSFLTQSYVTNLEHAM